MRRQLDGIRQLRFLFGEPRFIRNLDPDKTDKKAFDIEDAGLQLKNRLEQRRIAADCATWLKEKVEIRSVRFPGFLHGKLYHIDNQGVPEALLGSSNFTVSGLGLGSGPRKNIELNLEVNDSRDRRDLLAWFDELWSDQTLVIDVKDEVLRYLEQLYANHSPEFIYFKTLFHIFADYLKGAEKGGLLDARTGFFETEVWGMLYDFQKDGVKGAINKILKHNGCIIADSVGLGKTFEALAVIKYFELLNSRVLVLCPKKLEERAYMGTFLSSSQGDILKESRQSLEQGLTDNLQQFLLELGKGFAFISRQERITLEGDHFYIDLVFYHTILKCYVLIDLKVGKLIHGDLGQMQLYVNYFDQERCAANDNPTLGLILCTDKNDAVVKYLLGPDHSRKIFTSRYKLHLPSEADLIKELKRELKELT